MCQCRHNGFSFKSNFIPHQPELWKWFTLRILPSSEVSQKSIRGISRYLAVSTKITHELKTGLKAEKIFYFLDVSGKVLSLTRFANYPNTLYNQLNESRLQAFRKTWKHVNLGKTQCWALFVISKATLTKTAIKPKFDNKFS